MNVLSLFDGMSCGRIALERAGIKTDKYYASEIDKYAITVAKKNYPDTIHIGSVVDVKANDLPAIDILIGGSPCQGFSFAGKQLNFNDPRSKLFFEYVRLLKECKPKYFLLENVKMKKEYQDVISNILGVEPIEINSSLVSAQNRRRLYWTNIGVKQDIFGNITPGITQPSDKGIMLKDVVIDNGFGVIKSYDEIKRKDEKSQCWVASYFKGVDNHGERTMIFNEIEKNHACLTPKRTEYGKQIRKEYESKSITEQRKNMTTLERRADDKTNTLTTVQKDNLIHHEIELLKVPVDKSFVILDNEVEKHKVGYFRKDCASSRVYNIHDKAVTLCGDVGGGAAKMGQYLFGCLTPDREKQRQNGQRFNDGKKMFTLTAQDKHGVLLNGYIRKLHPIECERLQTVPDGYTEGVSNSQRYRMLGNGWTVDVIAHIFGFLPLCEKMDAV